MTISTLLVAFTGNRDATVKTKAQLGQILFGEKLLSKDKSISCASCHIPAFAFADTTAFSTGIYGRPTKRNTPSVLNMKNRAHFFWDGRAKTLEMQALMPIQHPDEMGLPIVEAVRRLNTSSRYKKLFMQVFKQAPSAENLSATLAAFERSLETDEAKLDIWDAGDGPVKLTDAEERGRMLFVGSKAKCFDCHFTPDFTGDEFRNIGLFNGSNFNDSGRFHITQNPADIGKFKVPGLRNVAVTPPYMHNGMFTSLEEVLDYYNDPSVSVKNAHNTDSIIAKPLGLTPQEKSDIIAFLKTLTDKLYLHLKNSGNR